MSKQPANLLKIKRVMLGDSQTALAEKIGATQAMVSLWERGLCWPGPELIPRLAEVFGMSPAAFAKELENTRRNRRQALTA